MLFEAMSDRDIDRFGLVTEDTEFDILAFWANPTVIAMYPLLARVSMSYLSAVMHEATSERTFSDCGQFLGDKRRSLKSELVCAQVLTTSGERLKPATTDEIMACYRTLGGNRLKRKSIDNGPGVELGQVPGSEEEDAMPAMPSDLPLPMPSP
jgi:hypothetical protein